ncbi:hypothetical protein M407DRAFT_34003 [Tulasnella calospora MUT 4182]|uniref:CBM1 domain-containing protein n=1 Tax=Tulasnella calospora MUT 4182 TaxID=1051891 RepID=A0A0C3Q219_9AGAM|nr:hypothetical protein M407DRAFT_34003 [Tulasnella calospora MUT 4182]
MKSIALTSLILAVFGARGALAVVAEYGEYHFSIGQCGGVGYTGETTCASGLTCVYQNDWYYQCLNTGGVTTTTTKAATTTTTTKATTTTGSTSAGTGAKGSPVGFATGTTGGAGGVTVTPTTQAELITYLSDNTARIVILTKIFDFTNYYGTTSGQACKPWSCSPNPQMLLSTSPFMPAGPDSTKYNVTYNTAGANKNLVVGSNKTILGQGSNAGM